MKKPLIILVDDDPAVLSALESLLQPQFESCYQVVSFDHPRLVLDHLSAWEAEGRPIAVSIVDQKMPDLTGVELLQHLRDSDSGHHLQSLLLTGYAGLDAALAAKNIAGVSRFIEKPWDRAKLVATVHQSVERFLQSSGIGAHYVLSMATDPASLLEIFRLRYRIYRMTPALDFFLTPNSDETDINHYDRVSIILGLVQRQNGRDQMVGTLRLTTRNESPMLPAIREAVKNLPEAGPHLDRESNKVFPLFGLFHGRDRSKVESFLEDLAGQGATIAEVGRHALHPEHRRGGIDRHQTEGTVAYWRIFAHTHAIAGIPVFHRRHYARLGATEFPGVSRLSKPLPAMAIWFSRQGIRPPASDRIAALVQRIEAAPAANSSELCFCPSYPDCLDGNYATRKFDSIDIFCPANAEKMAFPSRSDQETS